MIQTVIEPPPGRTGWELGGGRTRWAHLAFTRINIELTILNNQVEELMNVKGIGEKSFLKLKPLITVAEKAEKPASRQ